MAADDRALQQPPLNWSRLRETSDGDTAFECEFVNAYLRDLANHESTLVAAWERSDAIELKRQAHSIKGASANAGADPLAGLAAQLEMAVVRQDTETAKALVTLIRTEIDRVRTVLMQFLAQAR